MKRTILTVDITGDENKFLELQTALSAPKAKIISQVAAGNIIVYVVESL